jgi:tRNA U34 5-methylaminomethyl-2-thiouridine-forming methyltransferase MnmC
MQLVKTKDGSFTFYNEDFKEWYHSKSGALQEAKLKFVDQLNVKEGDKILDICFGLGYNTLAAIQKRENLKIVALEIDPIILDSIQELQIDKKFEIVKLLARYKEYKDSHYDLKLILGPAQNTIKIVNEKFDIVFLDPFSPKGNPELWTKEFFEDIKKVLSKDGKLATYSCARTVRDNLKSAGFKIKDGIKLHRRGPSTIAHIK